MNTYDITFHNASPTRINADDVVVNPDASVVYFNCKRDPVKGKERVAETVAILNLAEVVSVIKVEKEAGSQ